MTGDSEKITRESLEGALRDLQDDVDRNTQPLLTKIAYASGSAAAVLVLLAYVLGRRSGRRRTTIVEVRRI